jgi:hypothetical protein
LSGGYGQGDGPFSHECLSIAISTLQCDLVCANDFCGYCTSRRKPDGAYNDKTCSFE